jgi:alanine racemase
MANQDKRTWAEVDLGNLEHNYREIRKVLPQGCRFAGLCKANAYGHGSLPVARRLEELGADYLAVSCFEEASDLRSEGIKIPILMLAPSPAFLAGDIARLGVVQALGDIDCARAMNEALRGTGLRVRAHIKLETGMGRTGFNTDIPETFSEIAEVLAMPNISVEGVFTHFAVSDEAGDPFTEKQFGRFTGAVDRLENETGKSLGIRHCANSGAVVNYPWTALDMVRPGLLLYGLYPAAEKGGLDLRPVMALKTRVGEVTRHRKGDTISYGRIYTCDRDMTLAVIPVGYADGLFRVLSDQFEVLLNGRRVRQVGRICMDMCMLDVTDMPDVRVGDVATVFGPDISVDGLADAAGTISYELLCAVSPRVPRIYL